MSQKILAEAKTWVIFMCWESYESDLQISSVGWWFVKEEG